MNFNPNITMYFNPIASYPHIQATPVPLSPKSNWDLLPLEVLRATPGASGERPWHGPWVSCLVRDHETHTRGQTREVKMVTPKSPATCFPTTITLVVLVGSQWLETYLGLSSTY